MKLAAALALVCLLAAGAGTAFAHEGPARSDAARGLVLTGLSRAKAGARCKTGFELRLPDGRVGCTHGPDPAPPGRDVREPLSLTDIAALSSGDPGATSTADAGEVVCTGDGVDGNRVQAVYAYPADGPDNYGTVAPYIRRWAALADRILNESASETGGVRHVRYVTDPACQVDVAKAALSPDGVATFAGTAADLDAQGFNRTDRKYLVWVDAYVYCGVATVEPDDRAGQNNANNGGRPGMIARIDRGCWGNPASSAEAHELVHILGGVQPTAPHGTWNYHCSDESELMCYDDDYTADGFVVSHGELVPLAYVCPSSHERLLDCNHDDYFSTNPSPDSWLAQHWNVADSSFLTSEGPPSAPDTAAPIPTAPTPLVVGRLGRKVKVQLHWTCRDPDVAGYWLWESVDGRRWHYVNRPDLWQNTARVDVRGGHSYRFLVHAFDAAGNASPASIGRTFTPRVFQERSRAVSYSGRWRRLYRRQASARHLATPRGDLTRSQLVFGGKAVAWVAPTSVDGGLARLFVDGRYAGKVSLSSATPAERVVVFSHRFPRRGRHRITVAPLPGSSDAPVDAFVVLR
jgi:hypothetical protein